MDGMDQNGRKNFVSNLTKWQIAIVCLFFSFLAAIVVGPFVYRAFNSFYSDTILDTPQSWDDENSLTLQDQIGSLTKTLKASKQEIEILTDYRDLLQPGIAMLSSLSTTFPTDSSEKIGILTAIQPYNIFQLAYLQERGSEVGNRGDYGYGLFSKLQIVNKTASRITEYTSVYKNLLAAYSMSVANDYFRGTASNIAQFEITVKKDDTSRPTPVLDRLADIKTLHRCVANLDTMIAGRIVALQGQISVASADRKQLIDKYKASNQNINRYAVIIGIPLFIAAVLVMYYLGLRNSNKMRDQIVKDNLDPELYRFGLTFSLSGITVLLLILSLLILGLAAVLKENSLSALFGAIAGYVLNNAVNKGNAPSAPQNGDDRPA